MAATAKEAARQIIEQLPEQATSDDIMYELYVKQKIEAGLVDVRAGCTVSHEAVKAEFASDAISCAQSAAKICVPCRAYIFVQGYQCRPVKVI